MMGYLSIVLTLLSALAISFPFAVSADNKTITPGASLVPVASFWSSPSGYFSFGFYPLGQGYFVGIWLVGAEKNTTVWTANRDNASILASSSPKLVLRRYKLVLTRADGPDILVANSSVPVSSASMLDSGNFVLYDKDGNITWQSFDYPTNTILQGQYLGTGAKLYSDKSPNDPGKGNFFLAMQADGNLVLYATKNVVRSQHAYWSSNTVVYRYVDYELYLNKTGSLAVVERSDSKVIIRLYDRSERNVTYRDEDIILANGSSSSFYRATLDADGVLRLYSHDSPNVSLKNNSTSNAVVEWSALDNTCKVHGICGLNSYCEIQREKADCYCYPGFAFISPTDRSIGCYRKFTADGCVAENGGREPASSSVISSYNITAFENMSWYDSNVYYDVLKEKKACGDSCLDDCNCWAALHTDSDNRCRKYKLPLLYGKRGSFESTTAFLKIVNLVNSSSKAHGVSAPDPNGFRKSTILIVLGSSLGSIAFLCSLLAIFGFLLYKRRVHRYNKLLMENSKLGFAVDFGLHVFSYNELEKATEGFNDELGRGLFGAVYKGNLLYGGQNKVIAVKRLENFVEEGIREFRAEMSAIGMTHHRNLVQLLGFCIEDSKMLLVYEFMSNGSLADLLRRDTNQPSWKDKVRYIQEVAKGVLYLHEGCAVHIIHGNLRSQNILLDESWTSKISDFGFARLLSIPSQVKRPSQEKAAYSAPEWQKDGVISAKTDVFSFGVVLLETICCFKRNIDLNVSEDQETFLHRWVYNCYEGGDLLKLVEGEKNVDARTLERLVRVGLWCTQDNPDLRPMMKAVILMLEGTVDVPSPLAT